MGGSGLESKRLRRRSKWEDCVRRDEKGGLEENLDVVHEE